MEMSRAVGPLGLAVAVLLLAATPAAAQMRPGGSFSLLLGAGEPFTIVLERPSIDRWRIELPSIDLPELPVRSWPPPRGGIGSGDPPTFELPIALPHLPDGASLEFPIARPHLPGPRPGPRPSDAVPEPSAALLFGLGTVFVGQASRRARRIRGHDRR